MNLLSKLILNRKCILCSTGNTSVLSAFYCRINFFLIKNNFLMQKPLKTLGKSPESQEGFGLCQFLQNLITNVTGKCTLRNSQTVLSKNPFHSTLADVASRNQEKYLDVHTNSLLGQSCLNLKIRAHGQISMNSTFTNNCFQNHIQNSVKLFSFLCQLTM